MIDSEKVCFKVKEMEIYGRGKEKKANSMLVEFHSDNQENFDKTLDKVHKFAKDNKLEIETL